MTKNPFLNACAASIYIAAVAFFIYYGPRLAGLAGKQDTVLAPIAMISLFTLSAAMMGYLFLFQPLQMFLSGEKKAAANLFLQTLGIFAGITILILAVLFLDVFR